MALLSAGFLTNRCGTPKRPPRFVIHEMGAIVGEEHDTKDLPVTGATGNRPLPALNSAIGSL